MAIASISGINGLKQSPNIGNAALNLQAAISSIVSGQGSTDVASVSIATQLQSRTSNLKQASSNLAQASSLAQVADGGAEQIQKALTELHSIAQKAVLPATNDANRASLNQQFSQALNTIDQIATGTSFNHQKLLNGDVSSNNALSLDAILGTSGSGNGALSIGNLGSSSLLPGVTDILSADNAGKALNAIGSALDQVTSTRATIGAFQQTLGFASANVDSALNNQVAAQSSLSDTDLATASTRKTQDELQLNAAIAVAAQGNKLAPALLKLVG